MRRYGLALALAGALTAAHTAAQAPSPAEPAPDAPQPAQEAPAPKDDAAPAAPVPAQPPPAPPAEDEKPLPPELAPALTSSLSPSGAVAVGDVLTLKLEALVPNGVDVNVPEQALAPFEAIDRRARTEPAGDKQRFVFELDLLALEPGTLTVPALRVRVVGPKGELGETRTSARTVEVKSPLANEPNAEPKAPTKPTVVVQDDYTLAWLLGGLGAIALIVVVTLLVQRWLARRPKELPPPPPPRPAWEVALERLDALARKKEPLLAADRGEEFIAEVSATLREYLGRRYGFDGLESTSDEIMRTLERIRPHKLSLSGVALLLEQSDLVKFARMKPDEAQCDDLWNGASGLVRATTPAQVPAASTASPAEVKK